MLLLMFHVGNDFPGGYVDVVVALIVSWIVVVSRCPLSVGLVH